MAKKGARIIVAQKCTECGEKNYTTMKNKMNNQDKVDLSKYCSRCKKHTEHKETKVK